MSTKSRLKEPHLSQEEFLNDEKIRIKKLHIKKHKKGFPTSADLVDWFERTIKKQNFSCYYCETSIFTIQRLISLGKLKTRKIRYGVRGPILEIDRKNNSEGYIETNCVLSCYYCNNDKSCTLESDEYKDHFGENRKKYFKYLSDKI